VRAEPVPLGTGEYWIYDIAEPMWIDAWDESLVAIPGEYWECTCYHGY
jgi:hypothetical protein